MKKIILSLIFSTILIPSFIAFAQTTDKYKLLAPLPCVGTNGACDGITPAEETTLKTYIEGAFKLLIGLAAVAAVLRIVVGGFMYMSSDAIQGKSDGKNMVTNSVKGLVLVIAAWLILSTINPNLLKFNLTIEPAKIAAPPATSSGTVGGGSTSIGNYSCLQTCAALPQGLPILNGGYVSSVMIPAIEGLWEVNKDWLVTEAMPPTVTHLAPCHQNGTCIDAGFRSGVAATPQNINKFINDAITGNGLAAVYEVSTDSERRRLITAGVPCRSIIVANITGPHFSVYSPSTTFHPGACP